MDYDGGSGGLGEKSPILRLCELATKLGNTEADLLTKAFNREIYLSVNYSGHYTARRFKDHPPGTVITNMEDRYLFVFNGTTGGEFFYLTDSDAGRFISLGQEEKINVARLLGPDGTIYTLTDAEYKPCPLR